MSDPTLDRDELAEALDKVEEATCALAGIDRHSLRWEAQDYLRNALADCGSLEAWLREDLAKLSITAGAEVS